VARAEAYLHAKFHLDPSNRLATIHQCYRQDRTGQRSDSIGRTVLQTVAQKLLILSMQEKNGWDYRRHLYMGVVKIVTLESTPLHLT